MFEVAICDLKLEVPIWHFKFVASLRVSLIIKSLGKRLIFRKTERFNCLVGT